MDNSLGLKIQRSFADVLKLKMAQHAGCLAAQKTLLYWSGDTTSGMTYIAALFIVWLESCKITAMNSNKAYLNIVLEGANSAANTLLISF